MIRAIVLAALLAGCTVTQIEHPSSASLSSWRLFNSTSASVEGETFRAAYSSDPQAQQVDALMRALLEVAIGPRLEAQE